MNHPYLKLLVVISSILFSSITFGKNTELGCLATAIYHEAKSEPTEGKIAMGYVIINRTKHPSFPNTICGVVQQRNPVPQFPWYKGQELPSKSIEKKPLYKEALLIAQFIQSRLVEDRTHGALFFHAKSVKPYWPRYIKVGRIGGHVFYKLRGI